MLKSFLKKILFLCSILYAINAQGQNANYCKINVDSLFQKHFLSLDTVIRCDTIRKFVPQNDRSFVYLIGFLSGINLKIHSYTGHPMLNYEDVINFKIWYNRSRSKINCESIKRGLLLLQGEMTEETIDELDKLKIN